MLNAVSKLIARLVTRRPLFLIGGAVLLTAACAGILASRQSFDTDILNLLPSDNSAVQGLKLANTAFAQSRELTFVIQGDDPDQVSDFQEFFVEKLRKEPWLVRVLDGPPIETAAGRQDLRRLIVPLLLNLPADQFRGAMDLLDPDVIRSRIAKLRRHYETGSPAARIEIETDPLGLLAAASRPLWETAALNDSFDIRSPDGRTWVVPVATNQPTLDAVDCRALMENVRAFMTRTREGFGKDAPSLAVTGRSAYVDEISRSMERDIKITSIVSLLAVTGLFWFSFRRILPLVGVALLLALSALVALALGSLVFHQLNVIAIGFCSILFGLGDDFGLLLYGGYRHARREGANRETAIAASIREMLPGILWVSLTTAIGFLALAFGASAGFGQLGVMVAIGVFVCAVLVTIFLFLFIRDSRQTSPSPKNEFSLATPLVTHPLPVLIPATVVLLLVTIAAVSPFRPLRFDTSPHSLEPQNTPAARALQSLLDALPSSFEPVMVITEATDSEDAAAKNTKLEAHLRTLAERGIVEKFASPGALILSGRQAAANRPRIPDTAPATAALRQALEDNGLNPAAFGAAFENLASLETARQADGSAVSWKQILPPSSPWWFVIDRMLAPDSPTTATFLKPASSFRNAESASLIQAAIEEAGVPVKVTGWTQTLGSLIPWARRELAIFGSAVAGVILLILAVVYRNWRAWAIHAAGLVFAAGATVATLKLAGLRINLLNVLAFPLMLAVGVDYGIHLILAIRQGADHVATVLKPVFISGLTTVAGFASLTLASNPSLKGLGAVCAIGVAWSLAVSILFIVPAAARFLPQPKRP